MLKPIEAAIIESVKIVDVIIPYKTPFVISGGACENQRSVIVELGAGGLIGYGESAPVEIPIYSSETTSSAIAALKEWFIPKVIGKTFTNIEHFNEELSADTRGNSFAKAALETAYWDLVARQNGLAMRDLMVYKLQSLGTKASYLEKKDHVVSGVSIGIPTDNSLDTLKKWIEGYLKEGYQRIKLKIKPSWELKAMTVAREVIGDEFPLWGDANSSYVLDRHLEILKKMDDFNCLMLEQPLHSDDILDHIALSKMIGTPICFDESLKSHRVASQLVDSEIEMVWNLKIHRMGGLLETLRVYDLASKHGVRVWGGTMPETGIGTVLMLSLASLSGFMFPSDVEDSSRWYGKGHDLIEIEMGSNGRIPVPGGIGVGEINQVNYRKFGREVFSVKAKTMVQHALTAPGPGLQESPSMVIEQAESTEEVLEAITRLEKQAYGDVSFNEWVIVPYVRHGRVYVLRVEGSIMAYAMFMRDWSDSGKAYLTATIVDERLRGKGYGTSFLRGCLDAIKREGICRVELTVAEENKAAVTTYRDKLGFQLIGRRKDEYGKGEDRIAMELTLPGDAGTQ